MSGYQEEWEAYRKLYRRSLALTAAYFFGGGAGTLAFFTVFFPSAPGWLPVLCAAPWIIAAIVAGQPPVRWLCPRCGKPYFSSGLYHNGLTKKCVHCGLPKWKDA